jgi:hypothetical protein
MPCAMPKRLSTLRRAGLRLSLGMGSPDPPPSSFSNRCRSRIACSPDEIRELFSRSVLPARAGLPSAFRGLGLGW